MDMNLLEAIDQLSKSDRGRDVLRAMPKAMRLLDRAASLDATNAAAFLAVWGYAVQAAGGFTRVTELCRQFGSKNAAR